MGAVSDPEQESLIAFSGAGGGYGSGVGYDDGNGYGSGSGYVYG